MGKEQFFFFRKWFSSYWVFIWLRNEFWCPLILCIKINSKQIKTYKKNLCNFGIRCTENMKYEYKKLNKFQKNESLSILKAFETWKDELQLGRKYLQNIFLTKHLCPDLIENFYSLINQTTKKSQAGYLYSLQKETWLHWLLGTVI